MSDRRREDPIFGKRTPLLFAHRGGKRERPESTRQAFDYAWNRVRADVLELDVQVTKGDERFVVWHGPDLDNVMIGNTLPKDRPKAKNEITEFSWAELLRNAWVAPPTPNGPDFAKIEKSDDTRLMLLEEVMAHFPDAPLNIEMKDDSFRRDHIRRFVEVLDEYRGNRPVLVVSQSDSLIGCFRRECEERYPTGLSVSEVFSARLKQLLPFIENKNLRNRALQTSHAAGFTPKDLIDEVKGAKGAVHVFLNGIWFLVDELDGPEHAPSREEVFELLDRGVDGIMTDRPGRVRALMDQWIEAHP